MDGKGFEKMSTKDSSTPPNFIERIIEEDIEKSTYGGRVHTRFPPEPNGYMHIGHAQSVVINFGLAQEYGGKCNLRFDDTNPLTESQEYVDAFKRDIRWLGFDWEDREYYASDYFAQLYEFAVTLIKKGLAYVDSLPPEEIKEYRGSWNEPGKESPYRNRSVEENLELFERMRAGEFQEGECVLRAKIDMASPNMNLRDPILYRVIHAGHYRQGEAWCVYPTYDMAHGQCDAIEGITHSICTLEFEDHRPLYEWLLEAIGLPKPHPKQIEFARLNMTYTVLSKRKLIELVEGGYVSGWDDPRMPTISGMRRRGYTPEAIRTFCEVVGVSKVNAMSDFGLLEECVRDDLNKRAPRRLAVLRPLKVVIENYPEDRVEHFDAINNPEDPSAGTRKIPFSRVLYIERDDFLEDPPAKFYRLAPGREVRLRYAYFIKCVKAVKDEETGEVVELRCTYDPATRGGYAPDGRKVKATIHWVSAAHALDAQVRLYDRLFLKEDPTDVPEGVDWKTNINPKSLEVLYPCKLEPSLADAEPGERYQFERLGYFCVDPGSAAPERLVFNRTVTLRDAWAKIAKSAAK
jgi:glutaminyl-tRNA synthetase